eukprot:1157927-Pelagomonas_calceolata.AAC.3
MPTQEVDRIEPVLYPLLRQDLARQGPRFVVDIGDKQIDYNETFRLYLVTRHPDPYLPPDASSLVSTTNFTVTRSGLEGQLLGLTLQQEQPELEEKKSTLLQQVRRNLTTAAVSSLATTALERIPV